MSIKKACVVFTVGLESEVPSVADQLANQGFAVCSASADQEIVEAAQKGSTSLPDEVKNCIDNAAICVFLVPQKDAEPVVAAAGYAGRSGKKIVAVCEDPSTLPQVFDDLASSVVHVDNPRLADAIQGNTVWDGPTGPDGAKRSISRVKCQ